jgi:hypothetical protein
MFRHYCVNFRELVVSTCLVTQVCQFSTGDTHLADTNYEVTGYETIVSKHIAAA